MPRTNARLSKADYEALASFRYALRKFLRFSEDRAHSSGLTPQQHQALLAIKGFPGRDRITIGELAERLQIEHHSAVGLADRLTLQHYTRRTRSDGDRRQVFVELTARGETILARLSRVHEEQLARMSPELTAFFSRLKTPSDPIPEGKAPQKLRKKG